MLGGVLGKRLEGARSAKPTWNAERGAFECRISQGGARTWNFSTGEAAGREDRREQSRTEDEHEDDQGVTQGRQHVGDRYKIRPVTQTSALANFTEDIRRSLNDFAKN